MKAETGEIICDYIDRFLWRGQAPRPGNHAVVGKGVWGRMQEKLEPGNRLIREFELVSPLANGAIGGVQDLAGHFRVGIRRLSRRSQLVNEK